MEETTKGDTKDADSEEREQENCKKHDITMEEIEYESKRRRHNDSQEPLSLESGVSSAGEIFSDLSRSENLSARSENLSSHENLKEVVTLLRDEVKYKKLSIETLQSENNSLRLQKSSVSSNPDKNAFQQYKKKIEEYQSAVSQRDSVIGQLQDRLTQCVQQQEYLTESAQQAEQFAREIETLKLQLKEATDFLGNQKWLSGVNPKEHMELKHKLISVQQSRAQDQAMISQLSQQMHTKTEAYGHLDHKYKLILRNHKQTLDNHKAEIAKHHSEMQQLSLEKEGFENRMKEEMSKLEKQHQDNLEEAKQKSTMEVEDFVSRLSKASEDIEKKNKEHEKSKDKSSKEVQDLMKQLQTLTQELSTSRQEYSDLITSSQEENSNKLAQQRTGLEEQFGQEITLIKQQMSTVHHEELTKLQHTHESELEEVTKQIDALERVQKEDSQAMVESLAHLTSLNQGLKQQLDVEQEKIASLQTKCAELPSIKEQVQQYAQQNKKLEEHLKLEQDRQQNLKNLYNSIKDNSMKEHSELQEQMLYQGEQRLKLEDALAEEQRKVKLVEEQKDLLEKEIQKYSDINFKLNTECNSLKAAKEDVNKQLQQIEVTLSQVKDHLKERKEKCEKYEKAYEELKHEKELWAKEKEAHLREREDIAIINIEFQKLEESIKEEIHARIELSKEKENICTQYAQLENRCQELSQYQEKCHSLTQKVAQMVTNIDAKEQELNTLNDLKEVYLTVCNDCDLHRSDRQRFSELCNEKHLKISQIISGSSNQEKNDRSSKEHDNPSTESLSTQKEKTKILEELKEANKINKDLIGESDNLTKNLDEIKSRNELLEIKLTETNSQIECLSTEMNQVQFHCKAMDKEKNDVEMERDHLMEQYRILESEYSVAIMKLDREVQLDSQRDGGRSERSDAATSMSDQDSALKSLVSDPNHGTSGSDSCLEQPSATSDDNSSANERKITQDALKDEKSLFNEMEKLKITVDEQNYAIGSLENENSSLKRTMKQLELEKSNRKSLVGKYQQELSEKLKFQQQVSELKLRHEMLESNLKHAETEANNMKEALKIIRNSQEKDNGTEKTLQEFEVKSNNQTLRESLDNREVLHHNLFNQSQLMGNMREEMLDRCKELLAAQELNERLHEEKSKSEEETRIIKAEIEKLKHLIQIRGYDIKEVNTYIKSSNNHSDTDTYKSQIKSLEDEVSEKNHSNNKLRMEIKHSKILHQLEKLQLQSEQPANKISPRKLSEQYLVNLVDGLERLLQSWKTNAQAQPVIQEFINIQIHKVYSLMRCATNMEDCYDNSASVAKLANQALRPVFTAAAKAVSGEFSVNARIAIDAIEKEISSSLSSAVENLSQLSSVPKLSDVGVLSTEKDLAMADDQIKRITSNIKEMINLKSQLVTSLNDVEERLCSAIESSLTKISSKIKDFISSLQQQFKTNEEKKVNVGSNKDVTERLSNNVPLETEESMKTISEMSFDLHVQQQQLVKEFQETTINMCQQAQEEKVQLLQSQKMMVHKILEDNQSKLNSLCQDYIEEITDSKQQPQSACAEVKELASRLQSTLKSEVVWVEQEYRELLEQYKYEQSLHTQAQQATIDELKHRLIVAYSTANAQNEWSSLVSSQKMEIEQMKKDHQQEIQRLEAQLTADDNQALGHLQNIYNDRDWYKKTVGQVSRITLQLLHYYSIAQHFTGGPKQLPSPARADDTLHQVDPTTGQVLNLSFLSDTLESQQMQHYHEEGGLSEGLISEALDSEDLNSNCESALDSTVMSEGMLDDMDNDEQVKHVLTNSYPQLMSILKGRWDRVNVDNLEKEVQELTISLQAAAGMLKIFILSNSDKAENLSSQTIVSQEQSTLDLTQYPVFEDSPTAKESPEKVVRKQQCDSVSAHSTPVQNKSQPLSDSSRRKNGSLSTSTDFNDLLQDESSIHPISSTRKTLDIVNSPNSPANVDVSEQDVSAKSFTQLRELNDLSNMSGSFTLCKLKEIGDEEKLNALCEQLQRESEENQKLEVEIHKLRGLVNGYEEEKRTTIERNEQLEDKLHALATELESTKNHLSQLHDKSPVKRQSYAAKMEAAKDIKDRMRMVLSAKDTSQLERSELVHRVSELEGLLEELNRERDQVVQHMKIQITDLAQQLDVADRQLKSSRVFIEEQAGEREKEMEELERHNEKLVAQLKEREAFSIQHANFEKEVESLERELREKCLQLQDVQDSKEQLEKDLKASWDKTGDLRDIIVSIEGQLESKVSVERDLRMQLDTLSDQLHNYQQQNYQLQCQLDELRSKPQERCSLLDMEESIRRNSVQSNGDEKYQQQVSLSQELDHAGPPSLDAQGLSVLQEFEERLEICVRTLEASHLSDGSISSGSEEDLSVKDHLEPSSLQDLEDVRALSPSHLEHCLGEKVLALERATEATIKSHRDLNMLYKKNQLELDDVVLERDILQQQSSEGLVKISELEARMEQLRRADHPMAAELRQRITTVQDDLENKRTELNKKSREVDDLKYSLMSVRTKLGEREEELEHIQSSSAAPNSLPQTAQEQQHAQQIHIQEQLQHQKELVEDLKSKLARSRQMSVGGGSEGLKKLLSSEKTAEIENLSSTVVMMKQSATEALKMLAQQDMIAMQQQLEKLAGPTWRIEIEADESRSTEILRRVSNTGSALSDPIGMLQVPGKRAAGLRSSISDTTSQSGDDCATQASPNITLDSVGSLQTQGEPQLSKVTERSLSLHSADSRLEEDFRASQDMLEEREAEIQQLNEEVEDSVHTPPLISETRILQQRCEEYARQVETLELGLENEIATKKDLEDEMEEICQEKERQNLEIEELKGSLDCINDKVGETESANQSCRQDIQNKEKEIKKLQHRVVKYREEIKRSSHEIQNKEKDILEIRQILVEKDVVIKGLRFNIEKQVEIHEHFRKENYDEVQKLLGEVKKKEAEAKSIEIQLSKKQEEIRRKDELAKKAHVQLSKVESQLENNKNINKKTHSELQAEVSTLNEQLVQLQQQMSEQARLAAIKEEQLEQMSLQLQHVHDELKEKLSQCNTEWSAKEEKLQRALADMREEHLQKESKQRNDYSESMTITIKDMTKVINEKEEIITTMKSDYQGALKVAEKERNTAEREASKAVKALKDEQQKKIMLERRREVTDASSISVEDLNSQVRHELQTSDGLDNSLLAYLSQSHQSGDIAQDSSTRASSALSEVNDRDDREMVLTKLHKLFRKISHDGLQMLTLSDQMFLRQHSAKLDSRQRNIIAESRLASPNLSFNLGYGSSHSGGDQSSLLQRIGILEQELSKKEKEMKRKLVLVEFRLEQEKKSSKEWRDSREYEKEHGMRLEDELRKERMIGVDQSAELIRLDAQLSILKSQLQKSHDDSRSLAEQYRVCDTHLKSAQRGLETERVNFSRISKLLNHERSLSTKTSNHFKELIKELHNTLEIERNRIFDLNDKLCDAEIKALNKTTFNDNNNTTFEEPDNANANILASNQFQLALEREQVIELRSRFEREHTRVLSLTEQLKTERNNVRTEILKEQGRTSELTKSIRKIEAEKETLVREISSEQEQGQQFLMRIRELESEVVRLQGELSAQAAAHQVASRKVRDEDTQLHITYTITLNKLGEAEGELYTLKQKIDTLFKEQEVSKDKEDNLKQELSNEKEAIRRLGLSGVSNIRDIDDFFKKQIRENLELCKSVLQLTDERHDARMQVLDLEANVAKLQDKLSRTAVSTNYRAGSEARIEADRMAWGTEKAYLQLQITRLEAEIERMKAEALSRVTTPCEALNVSDDSKFVSLHGKYLRSESWRKALIWQKRYLLVVLEGYQDTESHTMRRLADMANRYDNPTPGRQPQQRRKNSRHTSMERVQPKSRFRVAVLSVMAVWRMRFLVRRWRRRRFDSMSEEGNARTPESHSRATSRNSNLGIAASGLILPSVASVRVTSSVTGLTPPTKDINQPVASSSNSRGCRSLFPEQNSAHLDEYIERLDLIHNTLGLGAKSK